VYSRIGRFSENSRRQTALRTEASSSMTKITGGSITLIAILIKDDVKWIGL